MTNTHRATTSRAVIVGAGSAGTLVAREMKQRSHLRLEAVAFVDDDVRKHGALIEGVPVVGATADLGSVAEATRADLAVLAMPSAPGTVVRAVSALCRSLRLPLRTVPSLGEVLSGAVRVSAIREIEVSDLLRRRPTLDEPANGDYLRGRRVLVTGAGGSIGSELCRQILGHEPAELVLFDVSESALYEIDRDLRKRGSKSFFVPVIGNVCDREKVRRLLHERRPEVVFHAAAYKHIPLTETNEGEAALSIVIGTRNVVDACEAERVGRFVLISTDKAVDPVSVMGSCKRAAELLVRQTARQANGRRVTVRFGNVLASSGSVVPLFREQIAAGGPVTIGHPDLERYFMTLQEAAGLVICAADLEDAGDAFVLDMGNPVKILTLAEDLIRLSGLEPERDIEVVFTGLRPGEKMRESLFLPTEAPEATSHPCIRAARVREAGPDLPMDFLDRLERTARTGEPEDIRMVLREVSPQLGGRPGAPATRDNAPQDRKGASGP